MSNGKLTAFDWANVREVDLEQSDNSRRRMFVATCANGEECHLISGWPKVEGRDDTIHCADHASMNVCEGAFRVRLVLKDEELREGKLTLLGLILNGGNPGLTLDEPEKLNPRLVRR